MVLVYMLLMVVGIHGVGNVQCMEGDSGSGYLSHEQGIGSSSLSLPVDVEMNDVDDDDDQKPQEDDSLHDDSPQGIVVYLAGMPHADGSHEQKNESFWEQLESCREEIEAYLHQDRAALVISRQYDGRLGMLYVSKKMLKRKYWHCLDHMTCRLLVDRRMSSDTTTLAIRRFVYSISPQLFSQLYGIAPHSVKRQQYHIGISDAEIETLDFRVHYEDVMAMISDHVIDQQILCDGRLYDVAIEEEGLARSVDAQEQDQEGVAAPDKSNKLLSAVVLIPYYIWSYVRGHHSGEKL